MVVSIAADQGLAITEAKYDFSNKLWRNINKTHPSEF